MEIVGKVRDEIDEGGVRQEDREDRFGVIEVEIFQSSLLSSYSKVGAAHTI
jgi:hypothetical protein